VLAIRSANRQADSDHGYNESDSAGNRQATRNDELLQAKPE
jgi:hypothetical protein